MTLTNYVFDKKKQQYNQSKWKHDQIHVGLFDMKRNNEFHRKQTMGVQKRKGKQKQEGVKVEKEEEEEKQWASDINVIGTNGLRTPKFREHTSDDEPINPVPVGGRKREMLIRFKKLDGRINWTRYVWVSLLSLKVIGKALTVLQNNY